MKRQGERLGLYRVILLPTALAVGGAAGTSGLRAQEAPASSRLSPRVLRVAGEELEKLEALPASRAAWDAEAQQWRRASGDVDAVELDASRAQLAESPQAASALQRWVRAGGIVLLHTDAAQAFGFRTVAPRPATREQAGQMFGRARAALPLGAPMLLGGTSAQSPVGVKTVFYQLQPGDALVSGHPRGLPLLRVTDLADLQGAPELFASAAAPVGRGWALFTPRLLESHRADGALLGRNLLRFVQEQAPDARGQAQWLSLEPEAIEAAASRAQAAFKKALANKARADAMAAQAPEGEAPEEAPQVLAPERESLLLDVRQVQALSAACARALDPAPQARAADAPGANAAGGAPRAGADASTASAKARRARAEGWDAAPLWLRREEVRAMHQATQALLPPEMRAAAPGGTPRLPALDAARTRALLERASALALVWRTRLQWQHADRDSAQAWLELASLLSPSGREVLWQRGVLAGDAGRDIGRPSPERANWLGQAAELWQQAVKSAPVLAPGAPVEAEDEVAPKPEDDVPGAEADKRAARSDLEPLSRAWSAVARAQAQVLRLEPTQAMLQQETPSDVVIRYFNRNGDDVGPDPSLHRLQTGRSLGVHSDEVSSWLMGRDIGNTLVTRSGSPSGQSVKRVKTSISPKAEESLVSINQALGWRADEEELLAFRSESEYTAYRRAIGDTVPRALLWGKGWEGDRKQKMHLQLRRAIDPAEAAGGAFLSGDAVGSKLLMVMRLDARGQDGQYQEWDDFRIAQIRGTYAILGTTTPIGLSRLHAHALTNELAGGGTPVPSWMQLGLDVLSAQQMLQFKGYSEDDMEFTEQSAAQAQATLQVNGGLPPQVWQTMAASIGRNGQNEGTRIRLLEAQAQLMMRFFYERFGSGAVVETLQRLGAGQSVDQALAATTGLSQNAFFAAWKAGAG